MSEFVSKPTGLNGFELGEGPVWNPLSERLSIVDIFQRRVHLYSLDADSLVHQEEFATEGDVGAALPLSDGSFVLCESHGIFVRREDGHRELITKMPVGGAEFRCNDAKIGPDGWLWVGIMHYDAIEGQGSLWRVSRSGEVQQLLSGLTIPNGLDWWGKEFWFVDGPNEEIRCYYWDSQGVVDSGRKFTTNGTPDGLVIDSTGEIWLALWGEGRVDHFDKSGNVVASISVASPHSTSLCFAGKNLDTLVMTSAKFAMDSQALAKTPNAGDLFTLRVSSRGRLAHSVFGS